MDIEVFKRKGTSGFDYESVGILDTFSNLTINWRYYTYHEFSLSLFMQNLYASNTDKDRQAVIETLLQVDSVLNIGNVYFYIDRVRCEDSTSGQLIVSGKSLRAKAKKRIVSRVYHQVKRPELIVYDHLNNEVVNPSQSNRKLAYLSLSLPDVLTSETVDYQNSYGVVQDEVDTLCSTYDFGVKETATSLNRPQNKIELFKGSDLSDIVEFNVEFDNLLSESFETSNFDEATMAWVFGEGEGTARLNVKLNDTLAGLERQEIYVDARDIQKATQDGNGKEITLTDAQYKAALNSRGKTKLAEQVATLNLNGDIDLDNDLFEYGVDYRVGDRVRLTSKLFNLTKTSVLSGVDETYDDEGHHLSPIWDKETPTLFELLKRG
ncbi:MULTISPECIES: siphovirus ReqiPepy6 Gp37-like family protein [unclassified Lactococcus]|uniref:siphovirus ReqiPepy6 Gp37-like family protein n=1 Tax=unclassified Lactococcus TaxID=2643510 RepID=UPI0011C9EF56|nr:MULTISPECIES: siphovirus ReqiPepy6 Gp37-like family protein [unclassified Lactococcus]MQW23882.1 hypothetical protein [Lactococcus sp. dk101]TXK37112.1 hypothetical protein FVP42_09680 [Lactococcus sp. dk310]TXK47967.1 hypothetical protein FVP43_09405 [Lactococcus sp. dk322]